MNNIRSLCSIVLITILLGCNKNIDAEIDGAFTLNGEIEQIENGSWVFLKLDNQIIDSTQVSDNKFVLKGNVEHPKQFFLFLTNSPNQTRLWLEPGTITFKAKDGAFGQAQITGSLTQQEQDHLNALVKDYRYRRDSLTNILRVPDSSDSLKESARAALKVIYASHLQIEQEFIQEYPNSYVSIFLLDLFATTLGREKIKAMYNLLDEHLKTSSYGKNVDRFITLNKNLQVGDQYVDFAMANENGQLVKLSDFRGRLILLDFWASWCGPCIEEYPALKEAYDKFKDQGFEIVSLSQDASKTRWLKAIEEHSLNWINLWNEQGNKADPYLIYRISGIPDNFLINDKGVIVARNLRGKELIETIELHL